SQKGDLCVVETPLRTPYLRPVVETRSRCPGCLYSRPHHLTTTTTSTTTTTTTATTTTTHTPPITQVHIVVVGEPEGGAVEVVVEGEGEAEKQHGGGSGGGVVGRVALILHSIHTTPPIVFTVSATRLDNRTKHLFMVSGEDKVRGRGVGYSVGRWQVSEGLSSGRWGGSLVEAAREKFGFVTSFTRLRRANKVILSLTHGADEGEGADDECEARAGVVLDEEGGQDSRVAQCFMSVEQPVEGCFHYNMLGQNDKDIHIIEVEGSSNMNGSVTLWLVGGRTGGWKVTSGDSVGRNMTLVLRASRPTTWSLRTAALHGTITLLVVGSDQVENTSVSGAGAGGDGARGVKVEVRREDEPAGFEDLIMMVLRSEGPPVSYARIEAPTAITLTVPPTPESRLIFPSYHPDDDRPTVYVEEPESVVRGSLQVSCQDDSMIVLLPYSATRRLSAGGGLAGMTLSDISCAGRRNGSHWVIHASLSRCGFVRSASHLSRANRPGVTTYTNYVTVELGPSLSDDEDLDGSGYGAQDDSFPTHLSPIRVQCHIKPNPPPPPTTPPPPPPHTPQHKTVNEGVGGATYRLEMFRDRQHRHPFPPHHHRHLPSTAPLHHPLYVTASLASVMPWTEAYDVDLRVMLEECWLSDTPDPTPPRPMPRSGTGAMVTPLVRKSCRVAPTVTVDPPDYNSPKASFSFQVPSEYALVSSFYLHCQLGVCSADSLPRPAVNRCIKPGPHCSEEALMRVFDGQPSSSSLHTLTLGPLALHATTKSALSGGNVKATTIINEGSRNDKSNPAVPSAEGTDKAQIIVLGGLSTEVVVGIALASFAIGVCLTATLWLIHMKTDPRRQKRPDVGGPRNSGYDLSAHSGSSTPSSQAPMTA
ncbi:hypothetical protein Pmani_000541, partial [Petrolisthes manimaculis]